MKERFLKRVLEEQDRVNDTRKTQVATTGGTYEKTGKFLAGKLHPGSKIISIGAGLEHTKKALSTGLGAGHSHTIHDMEPNPQGRKEAPEYTHAKQIPSNHYHAAVSHNVLNVVEPHVREHVMHSIFHSIKEGGHAVIGTRKFKGDIDKAKNSEPASEPKAIWVKKGNTSSYQKGFDGNELKDYVHDYAKRHGHSVTVNKLPGIAANAVHVHLHKKGSTMNEGMDDYNSIAKELIKRHGKDVTKQHIKDMEGERDDESALDHDQVMDAVKKHLKEARLPASVIKSIRLATNGTAQARFVKSLKRGPNPYDVDARAKKLQDMISRMRQVKEQKSMDPRKHGVFQQQPDGKFKRMSQLDLLKQRLMKKHGDKLKK